MNKIAVTNKIICSLTASVKLEAVEALSPTNYEMCAYQSGAYSLVTIFREREGVLTSPLPLFLEEWEALSNTVLLFGR